MSGPGNGNKVRQAPQLTNLLPDKNLRDCVSSRDEVQFRFWLLFGKFSQGVEGVGDSVPIDIRSAHRKARVGSCGNDGHQIAVLSTADGSFVAWLTSGNEYHFIQLESIGGFARCHQVAVVNWVKGATHYANSQTAGSHQLLMACPLASTIIAI
jgi:hypothetical protein